MDATSSMDTYSPITVGTSCPPLSISTTASGCNMSNGSITVTANFGTAPYTYSLNGAPFQGSNVFNGLAAGGYTVKVLDANGTASVANGILVVANCPNVSLSATNATCGQANGSITAMGANGTAPYQYSIDGTNFVTSNIFNGLAPGNYSIYLKDANGGTANSTITITNVCLLVSAVATNSTCSGSNGSILVSASNGTSPYQYSLDGTNYQAGPLLQGLVAGNYTVYAEDANGLVNSTSVVVGNTAGPTLSLSAISASCAGNDGYVTASISDGTAPFQFSVNGSAFQASPVFNGLDTGMQMVNVMDAIGCTASQSILVPLSNTLTLSTLGNSNICEGKNSNLTILSNGVSFSWAPNIGLNDPSAASPIASPSSTTKYYVTAVNGICKKTDSITVNVWAAPVANAGMDSSICFGKSIQLQGSGGTRFQWSPSLYLDNPKIPDPVVQAPPTSITYLSSVTDANGCQSLKTSSVTITVTPSAKVFAGNDTSVLIGHSPFRWMQLMWAIADLTSTLGRPLPDLMIPTSKTRLRPSMPILFIRSLPAPPMVVRLAVHCR